MADNRTGLSAADIAEQFRDVCGDGSMEWVSKAWQTWVLLDAADMLDENDRLREELADAPKCEACEAMLDCDECLRADADHKARKALKAENERLRGRVHELETKYGGAVDAVLEKDKRITWLCKRLNGEMAENAKLRQLVRDLWEFGCGPNSGANSAAEWAEMADDLHDRMRELGVDDG